MKQVIVGTYHLGSECVQVVLREGDGGDFRFVPGDIPWPRIKIGADQQSWYDVVSALLHEATEFSATRLQLRWRPSLDYGNDNGGWLFLMTHTQLSEVCGRVAGFLADCLPDLGAAWKKWKKETKKNRGSDR